MRLMFLIIAGKNYQKKKVGVNGNKHNGAAIGNSEQNMGEKKVVAMLLKLLNTNTEI